MKVYLVSKNADDIEGRGPMLPHAIFSDGEEAIRYVSTQPGIMGSPQRIDRNHRGFYAYGNGYQITEWEVLDTVEEFGRLQNAIAREKALAKLSDEEKKLLGLA